MATVRFNLLLIGLLDGLGLVQLVYVLPRLPERVATHFDLAGNPNGYMTKADFAPFYCLLLAFLTFLYVALWWLIPLAPHRITIPHREYWLAQERREQTLQAITSHLTGLGVITLGFIICIFQLVFLANLVDQRLDNTSFLIAIGVFLAALIHWSVQFLRRFSRPNL